ncbi:hypothetical protein CRYUN_Cryun20dG0028300 [Craigia yunnanensis]
MENVPTVPQPPDLFPSFELVQANGTVLWWVPYDDKFIELYNGKDFPEEESGSGRVLGCCSGWVFRPDRVCFEEIGESHSQLVKKGKN